MSLKKTLQVPVVSDGVPTVTDPRPFVDRTREIVEGGTASAENAAKPAAAPAVPQPVSADDITVPVHSSIESSLTFEVLRRQSKSDDEGEKKK